MIVFPNAKINLGLDVLSRKKDGYHNISSCIYPIGLCDILEVIKSSDLQFDITGTTIPGDASNNLCLKAFHLLSKDFDLSPVHMHLHKVIPTGAGLGGGSTDAAYTLICLNELFGLNLTNKRLEEYASQLGSDCAFFIQIDRCWHWEPGSIFQTSELISKASI